MRKTQLSKRVIIGCIIAALILMLAGCTISSPTSASTTYYAYDESGAMLSDEYFILTDKMWQYADGSYGEYLVRETTIYMYDAQGEVAHQGVIRGGVLCMSMGDKTIFYYPEGETPEKYKASVITVYQLAVELGYQGTLEDLLSTIRGETGATGVGISSIAKTGTEGNEDTYTITMTNGTKYTFTITNGSNGKDGMDGIDGKDASVNFTLDDLYNSAKNNGYTGTYLEFLKEYLNVGVVDDTSFVARAEASTVSIFALNNAMTQGGHAAGIIYKLDKTNGNAYIVTNFHVVFDSSTGGIREKFLCYTYGTLVTANSTTQSAININPELGAMEAEYIGGCSTYDIAVLKISNNEYLKTSCAVEAKIGNSSNICEGETVYAVGTPVALDTYIGVTKGVVTYSSEYKYDTPIDDNTTLEKIRAIRTDAAINSGNSGGGLYNTRGEVIGVVNSKLISAQYDNIGYAIPSNVAFGIVENILTQYNADPSKTYRVYKPILGIYIGPYRQYGVYDESTGKIYIKQEIQVSSVGEGVLAEGHLQQYDFIVSQKINDGEWQDVYCLYDIIDRFYTVKLGDKVTYKVSRPTLDEDGKILSSEEIEVEITITEEAFTNIQ